MATLEKIRSKSAFLFIVIIVALLAFILGDFLSGKFSMSAGSATTIAKAGKEKVDLADYQKALNEASQAMNAQGRRSDNDELAQSTIRQLMFKALLESQMEDLGINVTKGEMSRAMTGETPHPAAQQFLMATAQYLGLPSADGNVILDVMDSPEKYGLTAEQTNYVAQQVFGTPTLREAWAQQEGNVKDAIRQQAFGSLISGLFTANDLDAETLYDDNMTTTIVSYVSTPLSAIADADVEVNDADLKAKWDENKNAYRLEEQTRLVDYVVVEITPSAADYAQAQTEIAEVIPVLKEQAGTDILNSNPKFDRQLVSGPVAKLKDNADLRLVPDSMLAEGKVYLSPLRSNTYTITKVLSRSMQVDSVQLASVAFPTVAQADSVMALIAAGTPMDTIMAQNAEYAMPATWYALAGNAQVPEAMKTLFTANDVKKPFVYSDSLQGTGAVIFNIVERRSPVATAEVAVAKYVIDPSAATISDLKTQLNSFLASNAKAEKFAANADSLYRLQHATVSASSPHIGNLPDSRRAVKWAMEGKKGQVSKVFDNNQDYFLVVAINDIYDGFTPYTDPQLKEYLTQQVMADKKAQKVIAQYDGKAKDLAGYAQLMNTTVLTDSAAVFTAPRFGALGFGESKVQGAMAGAPAKTLVGPIQGANSVVYLMVDSTNKEGRPFNAEQDRQSFLQQFGINDYFMMLLGDNKIENKSLKFISED